MTAAPPGRTENLAELENLNEQTLLNELKVRFRQDLIYTYVGEILVTINPFKWVEGIYDHSKTRLYTNIGDKKHHPPHLFATADIAFQNLAGNKAHQCVVVSGESGAGKTEAAKLFVKHVISVSSGVEFEGLEQRLIQVNPLLEAFGNAKTGLNNNSSRFGKFLDMRFTNQGIIKGAVIREYLLEKSRIAYQTSDEQNFHIFYLLFSGFSATDKREYEMREPSSYRYLCANSSAIKRIGCKEWLDMYKELDECFKIVGFTTEQKEDLFSLLSAVLHLGDIEFDGDDGARIVSPKELLTAACNQLNIDEEALELALTRSVNIIRGEETERAYNVRQADDCRDAAAKALYGRAFSWIVEQCNKLLAPHKNAQSEAKGDLSLGILDIFGFENFNTNSFEQLNINLANEQLQHFFNEHIFAMELAEYAKEGISGKNITYENNQPLLDLILQTKPLGLYGIIDEESNFPKATDSTMIQKFHSTFTGHKDYARPRGNEDVFTLSHYAGKVVYDGYGFLEKNRDTLAVDVIGAFRLSTNNLVRTLFEGDAAASKKAKPGERKRLERGLSRAGLRQSMKVARAKEAAKKKVTVAQGFKDSLVQLMTQLNAASPHFVRCIKPNTSKEANLFTDDFVLKQLRYTGMLETTRIRREGYSSRPLFADFCQRYQGIGYYWSAKVEPAPHTCRRILEKAGIKGFEIGKTKVFLRYWHVDQLNEKLLPVHKAAIVVQKCIRGHAQRKIFKRLLKKKREQDAAVGAFLNSVERNCMGLRDVVSHLCEEDNKRPLSYWESSSSAPPIPPKKEEQTLPRSKKSAGVSRAASVKWFKEVEKKKGAGQSGGGGFAKWFHGIISRAEAESLLNDKPPNTFLVRVAESRFGYSLSMKFNDRCKHYMIDQDEGGNYIVVGNERSFPSLNEAIAYHTRNPVSVDGDLCLNACPGVGERDDLKELM